MQGYPVLQAASLYVQCHNRTNNTLAICLGDYSTADIEDRATRGSRKQRKIAVPC